MLKYLALILTHNTRTLEAISHFSKKKRKFSTLGLCVSHLKPYILHDANIFINMVHNETQRAMSAVIML